MMSCYSHNYLIADTKTQNWFILMTYGCHAIARFKLSVICTVPKVTQAMLSQSRRNGI